MQLVANGPDIPDDLLQAHEAGRVVFFCGAGISVSAGLPLFGGLVDRVYDIVGEVPNEIEQDNYIHKRYDATLDLLERRLPGQRQAARKALMSALQPNLSREHATDTHRALLELARRNGDRATRLVTTNFDRVFAHLIASTYPDVPEYSAPLLPIPKDTRWDGIVYLHGLLPEDEDPAALNRLVLTSGDFGLAYLIERWAARFLSELFRNYVVCFVGYNVADPVLRYMLDALAADRMMGENTRRAYSLVACAPDEEPKKVVEWMAKGARPILYEVPSDHIDHSNLRRTLEEWARVSRDGIIGKERLVVECALARPSESTKQDDFVGRMLWALSDETGVPAKRFAELDPVPSIDWLEVFATDRREVVDWSGSRAKNGGDADDTIRSSLVARLVPPAHRGRMVFVSDGNTDGPWDRVMVELANWLARHLDDPALILWISERGGQLHGRLARTIEDKLRSLARLERDGRRDELSSIRAQAPSAIPRPFLLPVWRLFLADRVRPTTSYLTLDDWIGRFKREGFTATSRLELRELLAPMVTIRRPYPPQTGIEKIDALERLELIRDSEQVPERLDQLLDCKVVLAAKHPQTAISGLRETREWRKPPVSA